MSEKTIVESNLTQRESDLTMREGSEVGSTDSFALRNFREYEIIEQLPAQGGEADIYVVSKNGKRFILKLYRFGIDPNLDSLKKIKEITNKNQRNFINILEIGKEDTRFFEIMEEASFGNLNKLIESRELNVANIYSLIESINVSLEILHKNNILHRDLKPSNILIKSKTPFDFALADFGISSVLEDGFSKKLTSKKGTELYWAPEASAGVVRKESDYFSLGVIVLEALLGKHPLAGLNEQLIIATMRTKGIVVPEGIDNNLKTLIRGLLIRDPEKRWGYSEVTRWLKGDKNIPVYIDNQVENKFLIPLPYEGNKFYTIEEFVNCYLKTENDWEVIKKLVLRGNLSTWLQQNSLHDEATKLDDIRESYEESDLIVSLFLSTFVPTLEFILFGKVITLNNLNIYIGKYLRKEASEVENKIVDLFLSEKLYEYLDHFSKISSNYDNGLLIAREILISTKIISNNLDKVKSTQEIISIYINKQQYILPYNSLYDEKRNREFFYENYNFTLKKVEYEKILENYLVPDSFYDLEKINNLDILKAIKNNAIKYISKNFDRNIFLPQKYRTIENLNLSDYMDLSEFIHNNSNILVFKEKIHFILSEYVLPKDIRKTEPETLEELKKLLESKGTLVSKEEYSKLSNEFILFQELNYLENLNYNNYIEAKDNIKNLIKKTMYEKILIDHIAPIEFKKLNNNLSFSEYLELKDRLLNIKDKFISVSEYNRIERKYSLFKEFKNLSKYPIEEYISILNCTDILITKEEIKYYMDNFVLPAGFNGFNVLNNEPEYIDYIGFLNLKESLVSYSEYNDILSKYEMPSEFLNLSKLDGKRYKEVVNCFHTNRNVFLNTETYLRISQEFILPIEILDKNIIEPYVEAIKRLDGYYIPKYEIKKINKNKYNNIDSKEYLVLAKEINKRKKKNYFITFTMMLLLLSLLFISRYAIFTYGIKKQNLFLVKSVLYLVNPNELIVTNKEIHPVLRSPLELAVEENNEKLVELLLRRGADITKVTMVDTILDQSIRQENIKIVKLVLQYGKLSDLDRKSKNTALSSAIYKENFEIVDLLLHNGFDANSKDSHGESLLERVIYTSNNTSYKILDNLLKFGANPNEKDEYGQTPLHDAAWNGNNTAIDMLLKHGAQINEKDKYGWTPLMVAVEQRQIDTVKHLIEKGAIMELKDNDGLTALDIIKSISKSHRASDADKTIIDIINK